MAKRKALYITGGIVVLQAVILTIFIIFNMGSSVVIRDKITVSDTQQKILTSDEDEKYSVSLTENYNYGLYTSRIEFDNQLTVTMEIITVKHTDESEEIMKVLFDVNPEEINGYDVKTAFYSQDVVEGEDIEQVELQEKSEQNILDVTKDGNYKKRRLKAIIAVLVCICVAVTSLSGYLLWKRFHVETNYIEPFDENSAEMRILKLVDAGPFVLYKFSTDKSISQATVMITCYEKGEKK